ncbi:MAG: starvation/stationary phase protection protein [Gammaproteobacteria bacterium]|jgi:starvation-inducible DNA-binding protein|nr:starvation/stationary phase protection protein [Gammaproteobacteria bacterium]
MQYVTTTKTSDSQKMAEELIHFLADTYTLYLKTQNFHWNVKSPYFHSLHKMFEEQYQELAVAIDEIAERVRSLGCYTPASFSQFANLTSLQEATSELSAKKMLEELFKDHEIMADHAAMVIVKAQKTHDEGTADLLIQRQKVHQKAAWMLKSSLENLN